jgi:hypothetical protein
VLFANSLGILRVLTAILLGIIVPTVIIDNMHLIASISENGPVQEYPEAPTNETLIGISLKLEWMFI